MPTNVPATEGNARKRNPPVPTASTTLRTNRCGDDAGAEDEEDGVEEVDGGVVVVDDGVLGVDGVDAGVDEGVEVGVDDEV